MNNQYYDFSPLPGQVLLSNYQTNWTCIPFPKSLIWYFVTEANIFHKTIRGYCAWWKIQSGCCKGFAAAYCASHRFILFMDELLRNRTFFVLINRFTRKCLIIIRNHEFNWTFRLFKSEAFDYLSLFAFRIECMIGEWKRALCFVINL